jgi:hypothetical protein
MPIKPENRARYPKDWKRIRERILVRARDRCEECGVENHDLGYREEGTGEFVSVKGRHYMFIPPRVRTFTIVLTIAHLDHTPENCADENLKALCQRCHLRYDHEHHMQNAAATRRKDKAVGELFA